MAEAAVEDRPLRFFCHVCNVEVQSVSSEYTCPLCSGGFIEELPAAAATTATENSSANDIEMDDLDFLATLSSFLARDGGRPPDVVNADDSTTNFFSNAGQTSGGNSSNNEVGNSIVGNSNSFGSAPWTRHGRGNINNDITGGTGRRPRRGRLPNFERFDNVLLEILHTLSGGSDGSLGNASMFFMGNPGDYAWGREGIDTIVTQLLNQMDTTGPPPLPKEKIDEIPKVEVTKEQVNIKLQCSVCWEDFKLEETVRRLPCLHLYHENCIVPWLELHGTCPICRKSLTHEGKDMGSNARVPSENSNLLGGRESSAGNSTDSNSSAVESLISNATGSNRNNAASMNGGGSRRLHISLPRFTLFGQSDTNRSAPSSFNYDLSVNNTQTNNSDTNGGNNRQETITNNDVQSRRTSIPSTSSFAVEQDSFNKFPSSSTTNSSKDQNDSSNGSGNVNNLLKNNETLSVNSQSGGNCNSNHVPTTSTSRITSATSSTSNNQTPQNDIYKFDDGQVDYEFD